MGPERSRVLIIALRDPSGKVVGWDRDRDPSPWTPSYLSAKRWVSREAAGTRATVLVERGLREGYTVNIEEFEK